MNHFSMSVHGIIPLCGDGQHNFLNNSFNETLERKEIVCVAIRHRSEHGSHFQLRFPCESGRFRLLSSDRAKRDSQQMFCGREKLVIVMTV
ncbi:hypothetical protein OUZ56_001094 [Daphnia magna]|uniref:Uncharacterized protein n=1 Tax=Daphnia magna TaxID=35525 RepID=A0ABR0A1N6_9CRUS|nr:hypothetical protein OUZ56_001094 [Daphnia magna]